MNVSMKPVSFVLINPFTKATIQMPRAENRSLRYFGCFSTHEGYPQCVVVVITDDSSGKLKVITASPGDEVWTDRSYSPRMISCTSANKVVTIGKNIYCIDMLGNMMMYNIWLLSFGKSCLHILVRQW